MTMDWRRYSAEFLGTFVLVFVGTTAVVGAGGSGEPVLLAVPFAFGLALLGGLYAFGEVSGGHFNPAVSLAMFFDKRLAMNDLVGYWVAQFLGAIAASLILLIGTSQHAVATTANDPALERDLVPVRDRVHGRVRARDPAGEQERALRADARSSRSR